MPRNRFTEDEIVLCTYAALFDVKDVGGIPSIESLLGRSALSITAKIQNIAAMLDEQGVARENRVAPLTGLPTGKSGRLTNWESVKPLTLLSRVDLLDKCTEILNSHKK